MEDKQAIEAIAKACWQDHYFPQLQSHTYDKVTWESTGKFIKDECYKFATKLLQTLTSLGYKSPEELKGYVKLADEQKLPGKRYTVPESEALSFTEDAVRQDMLSVDKEGCKWVRVRVK